MSFLFFYKQGRCVEYMQEARLLTMNTLHNAAKLHDTAPWIRLGLIFENLKAYSIPVKQEVLCEAEDLSKQLRLLKVRAYMKFIYVS